MNTRFVVVLLGEEDAYGNRVIRDSVITGSYPYSDHGNNTFLLECEINEVVSPLCEGC